MDRGHELTDELLDELEKKIAREYKQAVEETQKKLENYLAGFEKRDEKWQKWVADGTKTEAEYKQWRMGQIATGDRWQAMRDVLAKDYHNANLIARSVADGYKPDVYALNHNFATYEIEAITGIDTSYTLYNHQTVERLMRDDPDLLLSPGKTMQKKLKDNPDIAWQEGQIQSVTVQSILQGESMPNAAKRICQTMGEKNYKAAVRYARTAIGSAQNAGRLDSYKRAQKMGIPMRQMWVATLDNRTRHEHRLLDGQVVDLDEPFEVDGEKLRFPLDPTAAGYLVYNCRCTTIPVIKGFEKPVNEYEGEINGMTYEEWKHAKEPKKPEQKAEPKKPKSNPKTPQSMADCKDFDGIAEVLQTKYGMAMRDDIRTLDFNGVKNALSGAEYVLDRYPQVVAQMKDVRFDNSGYMCTDGTYIGFNPNCFLPKKYNGDTHYSFMAGAHEVGHCIDWYLITQKYPEASFSFSYRAAAWNSNEISRDIVRKAIQEVKSEHPEWKSISAKNMRDAISSYATATTAETVAESVGRWASWNAEGRAEQVAKFAPMSYSMVDKIMSIINERVGVK